MRLALILTLFAACSSCATGGTKRTVSTPQAVDEADLWWICYDKAGEPELSEHFSEKHSCDYPQIVNWRALPVSVYIAPEMEEHRPQVLAALGVWDDWLGTTVFRIVEAPGPNVVTVQLGADNDPYRIYAAAYAPHTRDADGAYNFKVVVFPEYVFNIEVLTHEFGHVLGLAHDRNDVRSIMYPGKAIVPRLTAHDRQVLCTLYQCNT